MLEAHLSPNPVSNILTITSEGIAPNTITTLSIITISGTEVKTIQVSNKIIRINITALKPGTYFKKTYKRKQDHQQTICEIVVSRFFFKTTPGSNDPSHLNKYDSIYTSAPGLHGLVALGLNFKCSKSNLFGMVMSGRNNNSAAA